MISRIPRHVCALPKVVNLWKLSDPSSQKNNKYIHSPKLTWKLIKPPFRGTIVFIGPLLGFHVSVRECRSKGKQCQHWKSSPSPHAHTTLTLIPQALIRPHSPLEYMSSTRNLQINIHPTSPRNPVPNFTSCAQPPNLLPKHAKG